LLSWEVKNTKAEIDSNNARLERILTFNPGFKTDQIPLEVAMLLPTMSSNEAILESVSNNYNICQTSCVGLFLTDHFLNFSSTVATLQKAGVKWVCNMPSIGLHDAEFKQYLSEVGMGIAKEVEMLSDLQQKGFNTLCIIASEQDVLEFVKISPNAICVMPQVSSFVSGFPSLHQRNLKETSILAKLDEARWIGQSFCYRQESESKDETSPHILRPKMI